MTAARAAGSVPVRDMTVAAARRALACAFAAAGLDSPDLDARLLLGHALRLDHAALAAAGGRVLATTEAAAVEALAARRLAREPVARIIGVREFWSLPIAVTPATLVPRPESETVVEAALAAIDAEGRRNEALAVADLGTGSGALLLALLVELPRAFGVGTDLGCAALAVARCNAARLGLAARARYVACRFGAALAGPFDLVVSNPPYIRSADIARLAPEVRDHDPWLALDGGPDGLAAYRAIAADAARLLARDGRLIVELGAGQAAAVTALFAAAGLSAVALCPDLAGIPRALALRPSNEPGTGAI